MRREFIMPPAYTCPQCYAQHCRRVVGRSPATPAVATRQRCGRAGRQAGFTLVEVVIAMALLILSLSAFLVSFVQSTRSAAIADNRLERTHAVRQVMETLLSGTYISASLTNGYHRTNACGLTSWTNVLYTVVEVTQATPRIIVKDVYLTNSWVNPLGTATSTVSLAGSICEELHQ